MSHVPLVCADLISGLRVTSRVKVNLQSVCGKQVCLWMPPTGVRVARMVMKTGNGSWVRQMVPMLTSTAQPVCLCA